MLATKRFFKVLAKSVKMLRNIHHYG